MTVTSPVDDRIGGDGHDDGRDRRDGQPVPSAGIGPVSLESIGLTSDGGTVGARARRRARRRTTLLIASLVALVAAALRLYAIHRSYNLFIDEVSYTTIARNLADGQGLTLHGQPFLLHPPSAFFLWAGVTGLIGLGGTTSELAMSLRQVDALIGAVSCAIAYLLVERASTRRAALVAAALLALDPFLVRFDSLVMLEAPAQLAALSAVALLSLRLTDRDSTRTSRTRTGRTHRTSPGRTSLTLGAAGVATAVACSTKATFGMVLGFTLLALIATGWVIERREAIRVLATGVVGYLVIVLTTASVWGGVDAWFSNQWHGAERLLGLEQETGFNAPTVQVTLTDRIAANLGQYAITYLLLGLGGAAAIALVWRAKPWRPAWSSAGVKPRVTVLVALWALSACAYLAYAILFGSLEEQMFYIMVLPVVASLATLLGQVAPRRPTVVRAMLAVGICAVLLIDGSVWLRNHRDRDDVYQQFLSWEVVNLPPGRVLAVTEDTAQFVVQQQVIGQWATVPELQANHVDYVVIVTKLVEQGYGIATPEFLGELDGHGQVLFSARSRDGGELRLYDVRALTGGSTP